MPVEMYKLVHTVCGYIFWFLRFFIWRLYNVK